MFPYIFTYMKTIKSTIHVSIYTWILWVRSYPTQNHPKSVVLILQGKLSEDQIDHGSSMIHSNMLRIFSDIFCCFSFWNLYHIIISTNHQAGKKNRLPSSPPGHHTGEERHLRSDSLMGNMGCRLSVAQKKTQVKKTRGDFMIPGFFVSVWFHVHIHQIWYGICVAPNDAILAMPRKLTHSSQQ